MTTRTSTRPSNRSTSSRSTSTRSTSTRSTRARFAERARQERRRRWQRVLGGLVVACLVGALIWVAWGSRLLAVDQVTVVGTSAVPQDTVRSAAAVPTGTPLIRVDPGDVARRVEDVPSIASAEVVRVWPGTLRIEVVERVPVATVADGDRLRAVDKDGVDFEDLDAPVPGAPVIAADLSGGDRDVVRAVVDVVLALPEPLRATVVAASAESEDSVVLTLTTKARVLWGSAEDNAQKAEVLAVLLKRPAKVYDVSAPDVPTTR